MSSSDIANTSLTSEAKEDIIAVSTSVETTKQLEVQEKTKQIEVELQEKTKQIEFEIELKKLDLEMKKLEMKKKIIYVNFRIKL
jgi:hypothetical protein